MGAAAGADQGVVIGMRCMAAAGGAVVRDTELVPGFQGESMLAWPASQNSRLKTRLPVSGKALKPGEIDLAWLRGKTA